MARGIGQGTVSEKLPPLKLTKKDFEVEILKIDPENGYDDEGEPIKSDNFMVLVRYPRGVQKTHQCTCTADLCARITVFLNNRYDYEGFMFTDVPKNLKVGAKIKVVKDK